jgi:integrative and conjugative element protein (TIGR02256 family)
MGEETVPAVPDKRMRFRRPNGGIIEFSESASEMMREYRQIEPNASEAGGMLLGRLINEADDVVIDEITGPSDADQRGRYFYKRSKVPAQHYINTAWKESQRTRNYLGEWHSHPEDDPRPSNQDSDNWRRIIREATYEQESLIFVIVGRKRTRVWEYGKLSSESVEVGSLGETSP